MRIRPWGTAGWIGSAGASAALLAAWMFHDYSLPSPKRAESLNKGRTWESNTRVDAKGVEQVWVPPGCFEMGSSLLDDFRANADETPRHTVCISAGFWLDRFEVTSESFLRFKREGGYQERRYWSGEGWQTHQGRPDSYPTLPAFHVPRIPRVKLSWYEAEAYAAWRGGALPTEAQWEWAARGPESRRYPWGNRFVDGAANMDRLGLRAPRPVGSAPSGRSWCGAEDMAGNVGEWVADGYLAKAYSVAPQFDPFTPPQGPLRVARGGAWGGVSGGSAGDLRCARRLALPAALRNNSRGARVMHRASPDGQGLSAGSNASR